MNRSKILCVAFCSLWCLTAQAQWQWIDRDGRKVFSDRPPPAEIPAKSILKQPGGPVRGVDSAAAAAPEAGASGPVVAASAPALPKLSGVDKDLAEKKKLVEAEAAAKVKAEQERVAKAKMQNCEKARAAKVMLDSGVRISTTNAKGEREVLDDAGRAVQLKQVQQQMAANCT